MPQQRRPAARACAARVARAPASPERDPHRQRVDERARAPGPRPRRPDPAEEHACRRPTSSRPAGPRQHLRPGQVEQARRADPQRLRLVPQPPGQRRRPSRSRASPRCSCPSPRTSSSPNGAVGSSTSPSICAEERLVLAPGSTPSRACATKLRNGSGARQLGRPPGRYALDLGLQHVRARCGRRRGGAISCTASHRPSRGSCATHAAAAAAPGEVQPAAPRVEARATAARSGVVARRVQRHLLHRQRRPPPHHLHRLGAAPPTPPPCAGCRAGRSPPAARRGSASSRSPVVEAQYSARRR